ncbi:hypothetical protein IAT40_005799 [Kwoniella sp. CBS 6097]
MAPKSGFKSKAKSTKPDPPPISPSTITSQSLKLFAPHFRPLRLVKDPKPPSLAWSRLPPPAAEIDERPSTRCRRFRLWGEVTPGLRKVVLDPRKRIQLRRYQPFAIPATPQHDRPKILPLALPTPTCSGGGPCASNQSNIDWSTPVRVADRGTFHDKVSTDLSIDTSMDASIDAQLQGVGRLLTPPLTAQGDLSSIQSDPGTSHTYSEIPVPAALVGGTESFLPSPPLTPLEGPTSSSSILIIKGTPHYSVERNPTTAISTSPVTVPSKGLAPLERPTPPWCDKSLPKRTRKIAWQQLLEYRWILNQEQERRFRIGMKIMMERVIQWQKQNALPFSQWTEGKKWKEGADKALINEYLAFFKAIRKRSLNIYNYFPASVLAPVPRRDEVNEMIRVEEERRQLKKERKAAKRAATAAAAAAALQEKLDLECAQTEQEGPLLVAEEITASSLTFRPGEGDNGQGSLVSKRPAVSPTPLDDAGSVNKDANTDVDTSTGISLGQPDKIRRAKSCSQLQDAIGASVNLESHLDSLRNLTFDERKGPTADSPKPGRDEDRLSSEPAPTTDHDAPDRVSFDCHSPHITSEMADLMRRLLVLRQRRIEIEKVLTERGEQDTTNSRPQTKKDSGQNTQGEAEVEPCGDGAEIQIHDAKKAHKNKTAASSSEGQDGSKVRRDDFLGQLSPRLEDNHPEHFPLPFGNAHEPGQGERTCDGNAFDGQRSIRSPVQILVRPAQGSQIHEAAMSQENIGDEMVHIIKLSELPERTEQGNAIRAEVLSSVAVTTTDTPLDPQSFVPPDTDPGPDADADNSSSGIRFGSLNMDDDTLLPSPSLGQSSGPAGMDAVTTGSQQPHESDDEIGDIGDPIGSVNSAFSRVTFDGDCASHDGHNSDSSSLRTFIGRPSSSIRGHGRGNMVAEDIITQDNEEQDDDDLERGTQMTVSAMQGTVR